MGRARHAWGETQLKWQQSRQTKGVSQIYPNADCPPSDGATRVSSNRDEFGCVEQNNHTVGGSAFSTLNREISQNQWTYALVFANM